MIGRKPKSTETQLLRNKPVFKIATKFVRDVLLTRKRFNLWPLSTNHLTSKQWNQMLHGRINFTQPRLVHREWEMATQTWSNWSGDRYIRTMRAGCVGSSTANCSHPSAEGDRTKWREQMDCSDVRSQAPLLSVHEVTRIMRTVAGETVSATWRREWMWTWDAVTQTDSTPHNDSRSPGKSNSHSQSQCTFRRSQAVSNGVSTLVNGAKITDKWTSTQRRRNICLRRNSSCRVPTLMLTKKLQDFSRTFQDPRNVFPGLCRSPAMLNYRQTAVTYLYIQCGSTNHRKTFITSCKETVRLT